MQNVRCMSEPDPSPPVVKAAPAPSLPPRAPVSLVGGKSALRMAAEILLIGIGVFLGLAGDQWRERSQQREMAEATLHRFRTEIRANRQAVGAVLDYHVAVRKRVKAYLDAPRESRDRADVSVQGLQPVPFERTAWDLALSTQALTYVDQDLAYAISRAYNLQDQYDGLTRGVTQAMYLLPLRDNFDGFVAAAETYFNDIVLIEPRLIATYDDVLARLDGALGAD